VASAYSVRPTADARVSAPLAWDEVPGCRPEAFTIDTMPARFAAVGDLAQGIDEAVGSLEQLLELAARDEAAGLPDAPWPPHFNKQTGEPPRVQPSKRRTGKASPGAAAPGTAAPGGTAPSPGRPGGTAPGPGAPGTDGPEAAAGAAEQPSPAVPPPAPGKTSGPTGRRRTSMPLIEVARAATKAEAMQGLDRWKERHADAWSCLEPADVLVDSMRGKSSTWTRIRLNLRSVPEAERPAQEALEVDFDPWAGADPRTGST
jgi:bifunctional non-homologous end joining protein LigD